MAVKRSEDKGRKREERYVIRVAIVEDDPQVQEQLSGYVSQYEKDRKDTILVDLFSDGDEILDHYQKLYDIIFLDIQMKRVDGMTTAKKIREMDSDTLLIFITNMVHYAVQGYSVDAIGFVLKPVNYFTFYQEMDRAVKRMEKDKKSYLSIPYEGGFVRINVKDIFYVESFGHRILIHTKTEEYGITDSMKNMEEQLRPYHFFRCNNSYIVNLQHVESVQKNIAIVGGYSLAISRPKKKGFMEALTNYIGGMTQ